MAGGVVWSAEWASGLLGGSGLWSKVCKSRSNWLGLSG